MKLGRLLLLVGLALSACSLPRGEEPHGTPIPGLEHIRGIQKDTSNLKPGSLAASVFSSPDWGIWPRDAQNLITISYCHARPLHRGKLRYNLELGIEKWMSKLGGPASRSSGHGAVFQEVLDSAGNPIFAEKVGEPKNWNPAVPYSTVVFQAVDDKFVSSETSSGFPKGGADQPWHLLATICIAERPLFTVTHELGHILGMIHEHQRRDAHRNIRFRCSKLRDFQKFMNKYGLQKVYTLCRDIRAAARYKFSAMYFIEGYTPLGEPINYHTEDYD